MNTAIENTCAMFMNTAIENTCGQNKSCFFSHLLTYYSVLTYILAIPTQSDHKTDMFINYYSINLKTIKIKIEISFD